MDSLLVQIASWLVPLVFAIVLHEISHGWVASAFGDPTARNLGRLTVNPIKHVDPIGTIALPLVLAVSGAPVFGWAKPVPVRADRLRNPRYHMMLVALAGPGMNLLLGLVAAFALALVGEQAPPFLLANLRNFLVINVFLAVFNLLPLPPFDGGHVVEGVLPRRLVRPYRKLARFGFPLVIFLLVILPMLAPNANLVEKVVLPPFLWVMEFYAAIAGGV
jgi:Zn-dependent protease